MIRLLLFISIFFYKVNAQEMENRTVSNLSLTNTILTAPKFNTPAISKASNNFHIHYLKFKLKVNPAIRYIDGSVDIYFIPNILTDSIELDLSYQLKVDSIVFNNQKLSYIQHPNNTLIIYFQTALVAAQNYSMNIFYKGVPGDSGYGSFIQTTHNNTPVIWTLSEPFGSKDWFPCKNELSNKIDSVDMFITHPSVYKATANGVLQYEQTNGGNTTTFFKHRYPIATYLIAFAVSNYSVQQIKMKIGIDTLQYVSYIYPESVADFQNLIIPTINALQLFSNTFGTYPFIKEQYGITQFGWGGGMEHQTNSFLSAPDTNLMVHELAHQWFGNKVTCHSWQHIWLNEGLATFAANYYFEKVDSAKLLSFLTTQLNNITKLPDGKIIVSDTFNVGSIFNSRLSYDKAAFMLRMLRYTLGDSIFFKAVFNYINDPLLQYNFVTTNHFIQHVEEVAKQDLSWFFNQWLNGEGFPTFNVSWSNNNFNWVKVIVNQTTSHSSVPFYKTVLPLTFKNNQQQKTIKVFCTKNNQEFWAYLGFKADTVLVDEDLQLISKNNTTIQLPLTIASDNNVLLYPNPVKDNLFLQITEPLAQQLNIQIYNAFGSMVYSNLFKNISNNTLIKIPFSSYLKGFYVVKIQTETGLKGIKKIIKY